MYNLLALFSGFLISMMVAINGSLDSYVGSYLSVFIIHVVGFLSINFIILLKKENVKTKKPIPLYLFLGGLLGIFTTFANIICFKNLGLALTTASALLGQSIFSCIIDHYGLLGVQKHKFDKNKLLGFFLILCGVAVMTFL